MRTCFADHRLVAARFARLRCGSRKWVVTGLAACATLRAADVSWSSAVDGDWAAAANWSSSPALPGAADNVTIAATTGGTEPYTVNFGTGLAANASTLTLGGAGAPRATLHMTGGTLTVDTGSTGAALLMNTADLVVASGAVLNLWTSDATGTAGRAALRLSGDSTVTVGGSLIVKPTGGSDSSPNAGLRMGGAADSVNTFTVEAGGSASFGYSAIGSGDAGSSAAGQNHVVVNGGSLTLRALELGRLANAGNATLTVKNGGTLSLGGSGATIGGGSGASGQGELIIGESGVTEGGTVTVGSVLAVGSGNSSGKGIVTLHAGSLTVNNTVVLGNSTSTSAASTSRGTMNIHGGTFTLGTGAARIFTVGGQEHSSGILNITGGVVDIVRTQGDHTLRLAPAVTTGTATATLNLSGGTLNVDKFLSQTAAGTINFTGGLFTVKQATVANGKVFTVGNGADAAALRLVTGTGSGTHTFADGLAISANARLEGAGTVGSLTTVGGAIGATGALTFTGGLTLLDGATLDLNGGGSISIGGGSLTIADGATIHASLSDFLDGQAVTLFSIAGTAPDLSGVQFTFNGAATSGMWVGNQFQITASAIPEPSAYAVWIAGAAVMFIAAGRRRRV